jgi:hypothetical protein
MDNIGTEHRPSPRAVTGKWLLKNYLQDSKIKPGPINQLKSTKSMKTD